MIESLLRFLQKNSDKSSVLKNVDFNSAIKLVETRNSIISQIILIFMSFFLFIFFILSVMFSMSFIIFTFVSYFGDVSDLIHKNNLPENIKHYFLLAVFGTSILSYVFFKLMKRVWSKLSFSKIKDNEEELKLEL